jgi:hypothetical protein
VKLDDLGMYLHRRGTRVSRALARGILAFAPYLMKTLSFVGTAAMFFVGGGIVVHGLGLHLDPVPVLVLDVVTGVVAGAMVFAMVWTIQRLRSRRTGAPRTAVQGEAADGHRDD